MSYDDLMEVIRSRRSIRRYKTDPISDEEVMKVLEASRWAPSGADFQPWEFVVVRDRERLRQIADVFSQINAIVREKDPGFGSSPRAPVWMQDVPVMIVVCADPRTKEAYPKPMPDATKEETLCLSMGAAVQNLHLAAAALGFGGSAWLTVHETVQDSLRQILGIPDRLRIMLCCPLGYPATSSASRSRRPAQEFVHMGQYQREKYRTDAQVERAMLEEKEKRRKRWSKE